LLLLLLLPAKEISLAVVVVVVVPGDSTSDRSKTTTAVGCSRCRLLNVGKHYFRLLFLCGICLPLLC